MPFAYYGRLSAVQRRIYRRSDALTPPELPPHVAAGDLVSAIARALASADRLDLQRACQALVDRLVDAFRVPPIRVRVLARRPSDDYGELHGLYEPGEGRRRAHITVWMRTAKRAQVVAFRSFLRTLIHEIGHHLDYELFMLEETFHTEGFYKRESSLTNALLAQHASAAAPGNPDPGAAKAPSRGSSGIE